MQPEYAKSEVREILVSVIIPTLNAEKYIGKLIARLREQTVLPNEIIVVDSSSEDQTVDKARALGVTVITIPREAFDHGGTRNLAAEYASGDILVFVTQDALPSDSYFIENLIKPFSDTQVAAVYGRQISVPDTQLLERLAKDYNYPHESMEKSIDDLQRLGIKTFFFTNVCSAIRSSTFHKVGRFPEPIIVNEDMILAAKCILAGYKIVYSANARIDHSHNYSLLQTFRKYFDIGGSLGMNRWLLQYTSAEGEGGRLVKFQIRHLVSLRNWHWIPLWITESVVKYIGYRMGLAYQSIPQKARRSMSMHPLFWERKETMNLR